MDTQEAKGALSIPWDRICPPDGIGYDACDKADESLKLFAA